MIFWFSIHHNCSSFRASFHIFPVLIESFIWCTILCLSIEPSIHQKIESTDGKFKSSQKFCRFLFVYKIGCVLYAQKGMNKTISWFSLLQNDDNNFPFWISTLMCLNRSKSYIRFEMYIIKPHIMSHFICTMNW